MITHYNGIPINLWPRAQDSALIARECSRAARNAREHDLEANQYAAFMAFNAAVHQRVANLLARAYPHHLAGQGGGPQNYWSKRLVEWQRQAYRIVFFG